MESIEIPDAPNCNADATLDSKAAPGDRLVGLGLDTKLLRSGGSVHADVNLSVDNVDVQLGVAAEDSLESGLVGKSTGSRGNFLSQVSLKTNTIDVDTVALDELDNTLSTESLVAIVLKVVVVVEELGLRAGLLGELEGDRKEGLTDGVIEGRGAVSAVLVEGLVDDVPAGADILVAASKVEDVVLHNGDQGLVVKVTGTDPSWKLAVPHKGVAVNLLLVLLGPIAVAVGVVLSRGKGTSQLIVSDIVSVNIFCTYEGEVVAAGLNDLPLHGVLRGEAGSLSAY